jgi:CheY-like chemotaxis protein
MKRTYSILLVEDDADDVFFLTRALRGAGVDVPVDVVNDGEAAVHYLVEAAERLETREFCPPRIVLLDLNLPHKRGLDVLRWIRQESPWKTLQVIVLTSSTSESDIQDAYLLGASSYVVKPSDATTLGQLAAHLKGYWLGWNRFPPEPISLV